MSRGNTGRKVGLCKTTNKRQKVLQNARPVLILYRPFGLYFVFPTTSPTLTLRVKTEESAVNPIWTQTDSEL